MIDPLHGDGYQLWSGIGGAILAPILIGAGYRLGLHLTPTRCEEIGCRRRAVTRNSLHGYPVCSEHDAELPR